jgi:hypothetical protein
MSFLLRFNKLSLRQNSLFPGAGSLINTTAKLRTAVNKAQCMMQHNAAIPGQISSFITSSKLTTKRHFVATSIHQVVRNFMILGRNIYFTAPSSMADIFASA